MVPAACLQQLLLPDAAGSGAARARTRTEVEHVWSAARTLQEPTAAEEKAVHGRQRFCLYDEDKNQLMQQECKQGEPAPSAPT